MAGLYQRVAGRGFPSSVADGLTGAGALDAQGHPVDPAHGQNPPNTYQQTLTGYQPDTPAPVEVQVLEGAWGIPGTLVAPDETPRTHAAPQPRWAGSYESGNELDIMHGNSALIHSADFGALSRHTRVEGEMQEGDAPQWNRWTSNDPGQAVGQVPLSGVQRVLGGRDAVQGYDLRNRYGFDAGHRERITDSTPQPFSYLDPAERAFIVPQASGVFTPDDVIQGPEPWAGGWDAGDVNPTPPTNYEPPPEPVVLPAQLAGAPVAAGWWS